MTYNIIDIQGIGADFAEKLKTFGVQNTDDLLKHTADEKSLKTMAEKTGITEKLLQKWSAMAGLMRVNGIGPQFAELLYFSGVDTVEKLREQPADGLLRKMTEVNATKNLTNALPKPADVTRWMDASRQVTTGEPVHAR